MHHQQAPGFVEPMLLASGLELPSEDTWWAELKLDGARGQLRVIDRMPTLRTRRGRRCDGEFPEILAAAAGLPDVILDGEIVLLGDDGAPGEPAGHAWDDQDPKGSGLRPEPRPSSEMPSRITSPGTTTAGRSDDCPTRRSATR